LPIEESLPAVFAEFRVEPGCSQDTVRLPGGAEVGTVTIDYTYDPLYRLIAADYDTGDYFHYTYDAVGNRLTQENAIQGLPASMTYTYDAINRLTSVNGVAYTWDANGNLLSDGVNTYTYTSNKLSSISGENLNVTFQYRCNGLSSDQWGIIGCESDRVSQTVNGVTTDYVLDIASPLTQVLQDGTNTYVYGVDRIAQMNGGVPEYFITDGLGSVRQLVDSTGAITMTRSYAPYGETLSSAGGGVSVYQFTGEARDTSGLTYLRARYLDSNVGRFISRDTWGGNYNRPLSLNHWLYVEGNPVNYTDPLGLFITREDIVHGEAVYSCNCGWIDFHHANPTIADNIHKTIKTAQTLQPPKDTTFIKYRQELMVINVSHPVKRTIPYTPIYVENIGYMANISQGLTKTEQWEVTLSLLMNLSTIREWASVVGGGGSHFSEEDLASDIIGFNLAYNGYQDARTSDVSWQWLAQKCDFSTNRKTAKEQSENVFDKYGGSETIREWHKPRLNLNADVSEYLCQEGLCMGERSWPSEFRTVEPDNDNWSLYIPWTSGFLESTGYENIYYSGYVIWR